MTDILDWKAGFTALTVLLLLAALIQGRYRTEYIFITALGALILSGILTPLEGISGFANPAVITVGALFIIASGIQKSRLLSLIEPFLMPSRGTTQNTLLRVMASTSVLSSFLNNTPIVAMLIPQLEEWAKRNRIPVSRLLIPLSYAAIVGGTVTLIGTSTNLIVSGMMMDRGLAPFSLFQLAWIGIPAVIAVLAWFVFIGYRYLPDRDKDGKSLAVRERERAQKVYNRPYTIHFPAEQRDYLPGVIGATAMRTAGNSTVASSGSVLFSATQQDVALLPSGVYTEGRRIIPGLLNGPHSDRAIPALLILGFMMISSIFGFLPVHISVIFSAFGMVAAGVLPVRDVASSIQYPVLIVIASALALGRALEQTGLAGFLAEHTLLFASGFGILAVLVMIYLMTNLLTELITNNAAAVLMIPIVFGITQSMGIDPHAAGMVVAVAASASFLSPIGYQTNLMVMKPGGYRFSDFARAGFPVTIILMAITIGVVYLLYL
ncbi:SLC13 family permease [Balneolaceae bacterium ANBcel3]|nr:SLC13 family permease [Balneolaceae bacterium ANBcel3]